MVPQDSRGRLDYKGLLVVRALLDHKGIQEFRDLMDKQVSLVLQDIRVLLELRDTRE
jgi:hypothetical protein